MALSRLPPQPVWSRDHWGWNSEGKLGCTEGSRGATGSPATARRSWSARWLIFAGGAPTASSSMTIARLRGRVKRRTTRRHADRDGNLARLGRQPAGPRKVWRHATATARMTGRAWVIAFAVDPAQSIMGLGLHLRRGYRLRRLRHRRVRALSAQRLRDAYDNAAPKQSSVQRRQEGFPRRELFTARKPDGQVRRARARARTAVRPWPPTSTTYTAGIAPPRSSSTWPPSAACSTGW